MTGSSRGESEMLFYSVSRKGRGVIRKCAGSHDLYQIRCVYVDPDWSEPWTLDFIRECYCYEGAKCVIDSVLAESESIPEPASATEERCEVGSAETPVDGPGASEHDG